MQGYWFEARQEDYIIDISGTCILGILPHNYGNFWVIGTTIFKGYYTVYDNSNPDDAKVGFAPSATSDKSVLTSEFFPDTQWYDILWELTGWWGIYRLMSLGGVIPVRFIYQIVGSVWISLFGM